MKKFENITVDIATVWGIKRMCAALREGGHKTPKYNYFDNNIFVMLESMWVFIRKMVEKMEKLNRKNGYKGITCLNIDKVDYLCRGSSIFLVIPRYLI